MAKNSKLPKGQNKSKGGRPSYGKGKNVKRTEEFKQGSTCKDATYGGNDVSWYDNNPSLLQAAANIPFAYQPGRTIKFDPERVYVHRGIPSGTGLGSLDPNSYTEYAIPGLCILRYSLSVGKSDSITSPINVAAREIYGRIRSKFSGDLLADAPDIMMYMLAVDSIFTMLEEAKRAYYLISQYTAHNNYYPVAVLNAIGWDFNDLLENKVKMRQYIDTLILAANKFAIPDRMDLFKRHTFMSANIYADAPTTKSQHYIFALDHCYELTNTDTLTELYSAEFFRPDQPMTVDRMYKAINDSIAELMNWDTSYSILGYLERAYENETWFTIPPVVENGILDPIYNAEVLTQIQNATIIDILPSSLNVRQDPASNNMLISQPRMGDDSQLGVNCDTLLTLPTSEHPTAYDVAVATRLAAVAIPGSISEDAQVVDIDCATEVIVQMDLVTSVDGTPLSGFAKSSVFTTETNYNVSTDSQILAALSSFRSHPTIYWYLGGIVDTGKGSLRVLGDIDNTTFVHHKDIANLHRVCLYSEFNCFAD